MNIPVHTFSQAGIDLDMLIGIFILISIVARMMKARAEQKKQKADNKSGEPELSENPSVTVAQQELESFLKSLTGIPTPKPDTVPTPPHSPIPVRPVKSAVKPSTLKGRPLPVQLQYRRPAENQTRKSKPAKTHVISEKKPDTLFFNKLKKDVSSNEGLRRAMVLREVLGPPLALREN